MAYIKMFELNLNYKSIIPERQCFIIKCGCYFELFVFSYLSPNTYNFLLSLF